MRRTPCATPPSDVSTKKAMSPVRATCVPPQNSFDSRHADDAHGVAVLLAEEGDRAGLLGVGDGQHLRVGGGVGAHARVHEALDLALLLERERREVREVEAQAIGRDERALLRDVLAERRAQRPVQEVRRRVVAADGVAALAVDGELDGVADAQLALGDLGRGAPTASTRAA